MWRFSDCPSKILTPVSKNVTQHWGNSSCPILNIIPHAFLRAAPSSCFFIVLVYFPIPYNNLCYAILPVVIKYSRVPPNPKPVIETAVNSQKARHLLKPETWISSLAKAPDEVKSKARATTCSQVITITAKRADTTIERKAPVSVFNHCLIKVFVYLMGNDKMIFNIKTAATDTIQAMR